MTTTAPASPPKATKPVKTTKTERRERVGPGATLTGSTSAKKQAAGILETLAGLRTPAATASILEIPLARYYLLETRALQGLVSALEPRPRGRSLTPQRKAAQLEQETQRLTRELSRTQTLLRAAQRSLGIVGPTTIPSPGKRTKRPGARATKVAARLRRNGGTDEAQAAAGPAGGSGPAGGAARG